MGELTRRGLLTRAGQVGLAALVARALPAATAAAATGAVGTGAPAATATTTSLSDATLQALADTIVPGRHATVTQSGGAIDPLAIAGADPLPGAVEADALALFHHPEIGFDALAPALLAELETRSLALGGPFLQLGFAQRTQVCMAGLDFANPTRTIWEAAAAVPFVAFCAAPLLVNASDAQAIGYRVMGLPGTALHGYGDYSYGRRLARERTANGSLP